ncbi:MAG: Non-heme chloroperoxidase, partial [uncultured Corynebacteriales bacterium]
GNHHRRPGEHRADRPVLRGQRHRPAGRAAARLAAGQPVLGASAPRARAGRPPRRHLRPARLRPVQPAHRGPRLRHPRRRPRHGADHPGPAGRGPGRLLPRHRGGRPLHRPVRHRPAPRLRADREPRAVLHPVAGEPAGRRPGRRGRGPAGHPRRPLRLADRAHRRLPQPRRLPRHAGERGDRPGDVAGRRRRIPAGHLGRAAGLAGRLHQGHHPDRRPNAHHPRHRRPNPVDRRPGPPAARGAAGREVRRDRGRPARPVRHPPRRGQPRTARLPRRRGL